MACSVLYWGGNGEAGWDFCHRAITPKICRQCDDVAESWRGRFDNVQVTLRMCAAEGAGFKRYVHNFLMLSSQACANFHLPTFYRWSVGQNRKVLTERIVLGTLLDVHSCRLSSDECGIRVKNNYSSWRGELRRLASEMQDQARKLKGKFAALLLDAAGEELLVSNMLQHKGTTTISRLLIILGGPSGISSSSEAEVEHELKQFVDLPLLRCSLPGGKLHSYYALATLFVMHDQGVLLPFLAYLADAHQK